MLHKIELPNTGAEKQREQKDREIITHSEDGRAMKELPFNKDTSEV